MRSAVGGLRWGRELPSLDPCLLVSPTNPPRRDPTTAHRCKDRVDPSPTYSLANGAAECTPILNLSVWPADAVDRLADAAVPPRTSASPRPCHPSLGIAEG